MRATIIDDIFQFREKVHTYPNYHLKKHCVGDISVIENFERVGGIFYFKLETYYIIPIDQYIDEIMDTTRKIRESNPLALVVGLNHAIKSFDIQACSYLIKQFAYEQFKRIMELIQSSKIWHVCFVDMKQRKILFRVWYNCNTYYTQIHIKKRDVLQFLISFVELFFTYLQFMTCYKNCIINLEHMEQFNNLVFLMDSGNRVPFSIWEKEILFDTYIFQREREDELSW